MSIIILHFRITYTFCVTFFTFLFFLRKCRGIRCNFTIPNMNNEYIIPLQVNDEHAVLMKTIALYTILQFKGSPFLL
jgi:hypothetical protein